MFLLYEDIFLKGLSAGVGVYDLLDVRYSFIQPYNGGSAPLPGPSREVLLKFSYQIDLRK